MSGWEQFQRVDAGGNQPPTPAPAATGWDQYAPVTATPQEAARSPESDSVVSRVRSAGNWIQNQITGKDRTEFDFPNLDSSTLRTGGPLVPRALRPGESIYSDQQAKEAQTLGRLDFASDDKARLDMIRAVRPDVAQTAKADKFGNIYVTVDGAQHYLNRPGLTTNALRGAAASAISSLPFALAAGPMGVGASLPIRAAVSGGVGALGSLAQDAISAQGGSEQGVDVPRAAMSAAFGAGIEALAPAKAALFNLFRAKPAQYYTTGVNGRIDLTDAGQQAFASAGIDTRGLSQDAIKAFIADVKGAVNPSDAARASVGRGLPVPVPMTKGDITGVPSQQMFESLSEKGSFGKGAESVMRGFRSEQQDALRENIPAIQSRIGGGQINERGQAGANVVATLQSQRATQKAGVDAAYDAARNTNAELGGAGLSQMIGAISNSKDVRPLLRNSPRAQGAISDLTEIFQKARSGEDLNVPIGQLFQWRRDVNKLYSVTTDATEKSALKGVLREFDNQLDTLGTGSLMTGDAQAVALWREAINKASANFKKWDSDTLVAKLADADPLAASNIIFGSKDAGFINSPELVKGLRQLRDTLPKDNWNAIREEAFLRLAQKGEGAYQGATRDFSGVNFKRAWDDFAMKNAPLARELFDGEERQIINQFANVAAKATGRVRGGDNFSNTTPAAANMFQRLVNLPFMSQRLVAAVANTPGMGAALNVYSTTRAAGAANSVVPTVRGFPALTGAAGNVVAGDQ